MNSETVLIGEQIDRQSRPGQPGSAVAVHRSLSGELLMGTRSTFANRYDWQSSQGFEYGLYGRGRYGRHRYLRVV